MPRFDFRSIICSIGMLPGPSGPSGSPYRQYPRLEAVSSQTLAAGTNGSLNRFRSSPDTARKSTDSPSLCGKSTNDTATSLGSRWLNSQPVECDTYAHDWNELPFWSAYRSEIAPTGVTAAAKSTRAINAGPPRCRGHDAGVISNSWGRLCAESVLFCVCVAESWNSRSFFDDWFPWSGIAGTTGITVHAWLVQACLQSAVARIQNSQVGVANLLLLKIYENLRKSTACTLCGPKDLQMRISYGENLHHGLGKNECTKIRGRLTAWKENWE